MVHIGRIFVSYNNESVVCMDLVDTLVEGVSFVNTIKNHSLECTLVVVYDLKLQIMIAVRGHKYVLDVKMRQRL